MPKLFNTVTHRYEFMPASYAGVFPYAKENTPVIEVIAEDPKPAKKKAEKVSPKEETPAEEAAEE